MAKTAAETYSELVRAAEEHQRTVSSRRTESSEGKADRWRAGAPRYREDPFREHDTLNTLLSYIEPTDTVLDVGGGASQQRVEAAFRILLADENVRAVLINIFGGIVRCDMVARGVVGAAQNLGVKVPVVVRLEGTNVEEGQRVIRESGLNFTVASGMKDAAEKVVALAG